MNPSAWNRVKWNKANAELANKPFENLFKGGLMDVTNKLFVVRKHRSVGKKNKKQRRRFYEENEFAQALERAQIHAAQGEDDFLVVRVLAEASVPKDIPTAEVENA